MPVAMVPGPLRPDSTFALTAADVAKGAEAEAGGSCERTARRSSCNFSVSFCKTLTDNTWPSSTAGEGASEGTQVDSGFDIGVA